MALAPPSFDRILNIYLTLNRYPVLSSRIRAHMRKQLFLRDVISRKDFNAEAHKKALRSQTREGLLDPFSEETAETWDLRLARIRDSLTDFYFSYSFPPESVFPPFPEVAQFRRAPRISESRLAACISLPRCLPG